MIARLVSALLVLAACDAKKAAKPARPASKEAAPVAVAKPPAAPGPSSAKDGSVVASPPAMSQKAVNPRAMTPEDLLAIKGVLDEQLKTSVEVSLPLADENDARRHAYVIYEHAAVPDCEGCPTKAELALNPGCKAYGIAFATFTSGAPTVAAKPLRGSGCELEVVNWVIDRAMMLEGVTSNVRKWDRGREEPIVISRRQHVAAWSPSDELEEPSLTLELAQWQWRRGTDDPPVRSSAFLHEANGSILLVELLPCSDPWSDEACDDYVRKRKVHSLN